MQQQDAFEILKTAQATKVGKGGGTIEYQLGRPRSGGDLHVRVTKNVGKGGYFGKGWVRARNLEEAIRDASEDGGGCFSSRDLGNGTASRCRNDPPFLAAVLLAEGLAVRCEQKPSKFRPSGTPFSEWEARATSPLAGSEWPEFVREQPPAAPTETPAEGAGTVAPSQEPEATGGAPETSPEGRTEPQESPGAAVDGPTRVETAPNAVDKPKPARRRGRRRTAAQPGAAP